MEAIALEQNRRIVETVERERGKLRNFIRRRVTDPGVFYELVEASRLMQPLEQVTAWMYRVATNRIIDLFRKKKPVTLSDEQWGTLDDLLPSKEEGPEASYARTVLLDEIDAALDELPAEQRDVFVAHELKGRSFKEISEESGVGVNTLLSRKHYAVVHLRKRLQEIYKEFSK
jgi:RNA polymerase sigma factor (sigma-70 family)